MYAATCHSKGFPYALWNWYPVYPVHPFNNFLIGDPVGYKEEKVAQKWWVVPKVSEENSPPGREKRAPNGEN